MDIQLNGNFSRLPNESKFIRKNRVFSISGHFSINISHVLNSFGLLFNPVLAGLFITDAALRTNAPVGRPLWLQQITG